MTWTIEQITDGRGRRYVIKDEAGETQTLPSVTTILGALPKGGLEWWGFKLGIMALKDVLLGADLDEDDRGGYVMDDLSRGIDYLYAEAKQTKHAPHRALKAAGSRGTDVHAVFECLIRDGKLEDLPANTTADEGYVDAVVKWHTELEVDTWKPIAVEELLFSATHRYAGQVDGIMQRPDGSYVIVDLKTAKGIYESHLIQLAAYRHAAIEMGLIPDGDHEMHVVRVGADGEYEVKASRHTIDDFLAVKNVFELLRDKSKKPVAV